MKTKILFVTVLLTILSARDTYSQIFQEVGGYIGFVAMYSDYGQRNNFETNIGNTGFGAGAVHYLNFSYGRKTDFNLHFMVRNEFSFHTTDLKHYGDWVAADRTSAGADKLRAMSGSTTVVEFGSHLEYHPRDIYSFTYGSFALAPFIGVGLNVVFYNPKATSELGRINTPETTPVKYYNAFKTGMSTTFALVGTVGTRYKLNQESDLMLMLRWHYYFSDWVDGLNPSLEHNKTVDVPENKSNDWLFGINLGYIYYLN